MAKSICFILLGFFLLAGCRTPLEAPALQPRIYHIGATNDADATGDPDPAVLAVAALIAPYKVQLDEKMNRVLAEIATPLTKGSPESSLGNWAADLTYAAARRAFPDRRIAFAVLNSGGLRVPEIGRGPLLVAEVYELMPFDNELVLVGLSGEQVRQFLGHVADSGGWPVSEQVSVRRRGGELAVSVGGQPLDPQGRYLVALPDYVANGGSDSGMLVGLPQIESGRLLRDLWIEEAERAGGPIRVESSGARFRLE